MKIAMSLQPSERLRADACVCVYALKQLSHAENETNGNVETNEKP